jgi:hypothetical protein
MHGQGYADLHFVIPETVEKIDFEKGRIMLVKGFCNGIRSSKLKKIREE